MNRYLTKKGFSLIEILMVIAIIGILSSQVIASVGTARPRARDSERMSNMLEIQKALNLYYDANSSFPISASTTTIDGTDILSTSLASAGLISAVPQDPIHPTTVYEYSTDASGTSFTLSFCLETEAINLYNQGCGNTISP